MANNSTAANKSIQAFPNEVEYIIKVMFVLIAVTNILLNASIWKAILSRNTLKTATNYLLLNLSLAHLLGGLGIQPNAFITDLGKYNIHARTKNILCSITDGIWPYVVCSGVALMSLSTTAHKRYLSITRIVQPRYFTKRFAIKLNATMWIVGAAACVPFLISYEYSPTEGRCIRNWGSMNGLACSLTYFFLTMLVPFTSLLRTYIALWRAVKIARVADIVASKARIAARRNAEKILRALVLSFVICWSPFLTYWALNHFTQIFKKDIQLKLRVSRIVVLLTTLNSCLDPLINIWGSKDVRETIKSQWNTIIFGSSAEE